MKITENSICQVCGEPATESNQLKDYVHTQNCHTYNSSGVCNCGKPGFVAHQYFCPSSIREENAA